MQGITSIRRISFSVGRLTLEGLQARHIIAGPDYYGTVKAALDDLVRELQIKAS